MTEKTPVPANTRCILAPHIVPAVPAALAREGDGPLYYLSWPGWELFLRRRLGFAPGLDAPQPIVLPDMTDAETDFKAVDQLNTMAAQLGANIFSLAGDSPESLPALLGSIRSCRGVPKSAAPMLDDRAYLALWAINDYQNRQNETLLAEALAREKQMWAALKGEEAPSPAAAAPAEAPAEPDRRTLYAWRAWQRLAAGLLGPGDCIVSTAAQEQLR